MSEQSEETAFEVETGGTDAENAPITETDVEEAPSVIPMERIEAAAKAQGWNPEKGDLDALEFLENGKWRDQRDGLEAKLSELEARETETYNMVAKFVNQQQDRDIQSQTAAYDRAIKQATEEGDTQRAVILTEKKAQLQKPTPVELVQPDPEATPEQQTVREWTSKQPWWGKNEAMTGAALKLYESEVARTGWDNPAEIFPKVEEALKEAFPTYYGNPNRTKATAASGGNSKAAASTGLKRSDLTENEARHLDQFKAMGMSEEKLLESIARDRASREA